jgi:hypothetical protein
MIVAIADAARANPAFGFEFAERLLEREDGMRRRRVAELAILLKTLSWPRRSRLKLRAPFATQQDVPLANHKREARHTLDALVRRISNNRFRHGEVNGDRPKLLIASTIKQRP